ncbi:acyl-protein synthetase [Marinomonas balearica]|uniref:Acyl-protein synthetase LuxE n=1 Tax=Marinomonas balearica TaxID=491947 RepID=A0A4R6M4S6_9GAMM|nr:acyl-protein synthetase [Marinomonas balearica]TDO96234.1 acyl-protein synthetase LuxE [Marinomonas balearica]
MQDWTEINPLHLSRVEKKAWLLPQLNQLTQLHSENCERYANILNGTGLPLVASEFDDVPYLAARLFKLLRLSSVEEGDVFKTLTSSGTTSQVKSQIVLDKQTASLQTKVLVKLLSSITGKSRRPMLLVDRQGLTNDKSGFSARGAGVQGLSFLGRDHTYALNEDLTPNWERIDQFIEKYKGQSVLIFGFTFMVWQYFVTELLNRGDRSLFDNAILFHSGGWKKLQDKAVDNHTFKSTTREILGESAAIHNFYGMVEQIGSVFVECSHGHLHASAYSDIIIRNQNTLEPAAFGEQGQIQVMSFIPRSYPGHSILTEDLGRLLGEDDCSCGWKGCYFEVIGRLPKTEIRGCSDVF